MPPRELPAGARSSTTPAHEDVPVNAVTRSMAGLRTSFAPAKAASSEPTFRSYTPHRGPTTMVAGLVKEQPPGVAGRLHAERPVPGGKGKAFTGPEIVVTPSLPTTVKKARTAGEADAAPVARPLPPGPFYLEPHTHAYTAAELNRVVGCIDLALTEGGVDAQYNPLKCKWKAQAVVDNDILQFRVNVYRTPRGALAVEMQRRRGDAFAFAALWRRAKAALLDKGVVLAADGGAPLPPAEAAAQAADLRARSAAVPAALRAPELQAAEAAFGPDDVAGVAAAACSQYGDVQRTGLLNLAGLAQRAAPAVRAALAGNAKLTKQLVLGLRLGAFHAKSAARGGGGAGNAQEALPFGALEAELYRCCATVLAHMCSGEGGEGDEGAVLRLLAGAGAAAPLADILAHARPPTTLPRGRPTDANPVPGASSAATAVAMSVAEAARQAARVAARLVLGGQDAGGALRRGLAAFASESGLAESGADAAGLKALVTRALDAN